MDIDKLIRRFGVSGTRWRFGSLMDIDKLIRVIYDGLSSDCFGSLMDIDKLIPRRTWKSMP